jgi:hydroxyquinol 1,2-dioxygenase
LRRGGDAIRQRVRAVPGAGIEAWEADGDGFYDVQYPDGRTAARAHPFTDGQDRHRFGAFTPDAFIVRPPAATGLAASVRAR